MKYLGSSFCAEIRTHIMHNSPPLLTQTGACRPGRGTGTPAPWLTLTPRQPIRYPQTHKQDTAVQGKTFHIVVCIAFILKNVSSVVASGQRQIRARIIPNEVCQTVERTMKRD